MTNLTNILNKDQKERFKAVDSTISLSLDGESFIKLFDSYARKIVLYDLVKMKINQKENSPTRAYVTQ